MEADASRLEGVIDENRSNNSTPPLRMNEQNHATNDIFDKHRRLVDWVLANDGYFHPHAQIAFSRRKGFHGVVADGQRLFSGARIASCPVPITISILNALDIEPFSSHGSAFPKSFLRDQAHKTESLQAFFLMEQLVIGEKSWWAPYIATLPTVDDVTDMQFEEETDVVWLEGTNLKGGISAQVARWKEMYLQGIGQLKQAQWPNALEGTYTWYVRDRPNTLPEHN